jgi:hypothetical protein
VRPEFKFNKGHSCLLMYACILGLSPRDLSPYICRFVAL